MDEMRRHEAVEEGYVGEIWVMGNEKIKGEDSGFFNQGWPRSPEEGRVPFPGHRLPATARAPRILQPHFNKNPPQENRRQPQSQERCQGSEEQSLRQRSKHAQSFVFSQL